MRTTADKSTFEASQPLDGEAGRPDDRSWRTALQDQRPGFPREEKKNPPLGFIYSPNDSPSIVNPSPGGIVESRNPEFERALMVCQ